MDEEKKKHIAVFRYGVGSRAFLWRAGRAFKGEVQPEMGDTLYNKDKCQPELYTILDQEIQGRQ